jgi:hypothetical protein
MDMQPMGGGAAVIEESDRCKQKGARADGCHPSRSLTEDSRGLKQARWKRCTRGAVGPRNDDGIE